MAKVTVIIPNYNHALYLKQRITSVLDQTYQDFELVLMDDCSSDTSVQILEQYHSHPKVTQVIVNLHNSGSTFKQWQRGISLANGEYIWIAESDDYAHAAFLEKMVSVLDSNPSVGVVYCKSAIVDENNYIKDSSDILYGAPEKDKIYFGKEFIHLYLTGANSIPNASAVLFRRDIANQVSEAYTHFRFSGDWWFWCEMLMRSDLVFIDEVLNFFRVHANKVSVYSVKQGLYFTEGLEILELLRKHSAINQITYRNKSKNWAVKLVDQLNTFPPAINRKILRWGLNYNTIFLQKVLVTYLRKKLLVRR